MITIALDEQGEFEDLSQSSKPVFIGGIIYDDKASPSDLSNEKKRLEKYLSQVCASVNQRYPQDLHFRQYTGGGNNSSAVKKVKEKLSETLPEFLQKGSFQNKQLLTPTRTGSYHIFAELRSSAGMEELLEEDISFVIKDDYASNLYIHMAEEIVSRVAFHNPCIDNITKLHFDLATRRVILTGNNRNAKAMEYNKLGHRKAETRQPVSQSTNPSDQNPLYYLLTNPDIYRTAIEREMIDQKRYDLQIDHIGVKSIYYEHYNEKMQFLHLADAICSILGFEPEGRNAEDWIVYFYQKANELTGHDENLIFAYDKIDGYFKRAWKMLEEKDYYKALSIAFEGSKCNSKMNAFYNHVWFPVLLKRLQREQDSSAYTMAIRKFQESIFNNNLTQEKLIFIYDALEKLQTNITYRSHEEQSVLYELYDAGITCFCHIGDSQRAKSCYEKCKEYARFIGVETYLRTKNKMVVSLCDCFDFEEALSIAKENLAYHNQLVALKETIFPEYKSDDYLGHALAASQLGQVYAYLGSPLAEASFLEALDELEKDGPNYMITESYLLHYYLETGNKEKYEALSQHYFGGRTDFIARLEYLVLEGTRAKEPRFSMKFALYVYVKALYTFYLDKISDKLLEKLCNVEYTLKQISPDAEKEINGHPWEIIYKYLALIALAKNKKSIGDIYIQKSALPDENLGLTMLEIIRHGQAEYVEGKLCATSSITYMYH